MNGPALDTRKLMDQLYPAEAKAERRRLRIRRGARWLQRRLWQIGLVMLACLVWAGAHVYYYNVLVAMDSNVVAARAQVEAQLNRRYNVQQNLAILVLEYARHERELQLRVTKIRSDSPAAGPGASAEAAASQPAEPEAAGETGAPPAQTPSAEARSAARLDPLLKLPVDKLGREELNRIFPQIKLIAEQYPQLRLSENFQQFSSSIVESENRITTQVMAYNETVNIITTALRQVPGNVFGRICGFSLASYRYYLPEKRTLVFQKVSEHAQ